jgi:hypothetical protein
MNPLLLILLAIAATVGLVRGTIWLFDVIAHDRHGVGPAPRSHPDDNDVWRRAA